MKRERFLIAVLWLSALTLLALWFFDMVYGFNLFVAAHWQYLSELQLANSVEPGFYISVAAFVAGGLIGLYLLIVPWHRKIRMQTVGVPRVDIMQKIVPAASGVASETPVMTRPPKLNLNGGFIPVRRDPPVAQSHSAPPVRAADGSPGRADSEYVYAVRRLLGKAGFETKTPPAIGGVKMDFWAIGPDEALVVGLLSDEDGEIVASEGGDSVWRAGGRQFKSPVWQMTSAVQKLEALFLEILDPELKIHVLPFVLIRGKVTNKDAVRVIWDALGIKVFDDVNDLSKFLDENKPGEMDEVQKGNFEAFTEFTDTVASYFNGNA